MTGRHCFRLAEILGPEIMSKLQRPLESIIDENNAFLFDATRMLCNWAMEEEQAGREPRIMMHQSVKKSGRGMLGGNFIKNIYFSLISHKQYRKMW